MTAPQAVNIDDVRIHPLSNVTALEGFSCGEPEIDRNINKCCEWHEIYSRRVYCAHLAGDPKACGFYCVGISATESKYLDEKILRTSETKNYVPFLYLNYLAVESEYQHNKIGTMLLMNLIERCAPVVRNIGTHGIALNALNDRAAGLYDRYGFREIAQHRFPFMILPAQAILQLFP